MMLIQPHKTNAKESPPTIDVVAMTGEATGGYVEREREREKLQ